MSLTGGREVINLVSSDEVSSGKEAMDVIDLSSEEDNGESNREEETQQEKDEKLCKCYYYLQGARYKAKEEAAENQPLADKKSSNSGEHGPSGSHS
ncbi:hypothetical protein DVH05_014750 [Phytophthora capsici]|nr:hypothetical protein DVH05_016410 [Phytophthora capsici]KAG1698795.1 hypothetical protein DVH05_014750 [Phytophthora capsici]